MEAYYFKHVLKFKSPSGTSRGVLKTKDSWFIVIRNQNRIGVGECSLIEGLSPDPIQTFEQTLNEVCKNIELGLDYFAESDICILLNSLNASVCFPLVAFKRNRGKCLTMIGLDLKNPHYIDILNFRWFCAFCFSGRSAFC